MYIQKNRITSIRVLSTFCKYENETNFMGFEFLQYCFYYILPVSTHIYYNKT